MNQETMNGMHDMETIMNHETAPPASSDIAKAAIDIAAMRRELDALIERVQERRRLVDAVVKSCDELLAGIVTDNVVHRGAYPRGPAGSVQGTLTAQIMTALRQRPGLTPAELWSHVPGGRAVLYNLVQRGIVITKGKRYHRRYYLAEGR